MSVLEKPVSFDTHEVLNQPHALVDYNLYTTDNVLLEATAREGASWAQPSLEEFGREIGQADFIELGFQANRFSPQLKTHDRYGRRIDEVEFHPAYHRLMAAGVKAECHALPWNNPVPGAHVARAMKHYLLSQIESGVMCPITMTFAVVPSLRQQPDVAAEWVPRVTSATYESALRPPAEKAGCMMGMAMTEKQGGSDVRANTTRAERSDDGSYRLVGHKFFCSAPMCDAFLTLAYTERGLTCFLVPRVLMDGTRNGIRIQRLKDKLGNRSNASSEIEYQNAWATRVGEEGRGVPTIIEMVSHTRLDCICGTTGMMRQALVQAMHHTSHRSAFGKLLRDQPLMQAVLADLALEWEASTVLLMRLARGYEESGEKAFVRIATAIGKYWVCKRGPKMSFEAMECLGGSGYVEECIMPRIYREMPVSSIWEGSGNVMALDVLRAMSKSPEAVEVLMQELARSRGRDKHYDRHLEKLQRELSSRDDLELRARSLVEKMALALQAATLLQVSPDFVAEAFCASRLGSGGNEYGTLPVGLNLPAILDRAWARPC